MPEQTAYQQQDHMSVLQLCSIKCVGLLEEKPWQVQKKSLTHDLYRLPQHPRSPSEVLTMKCVSLVKKILNETTHPLSNCLTNLSWYLMEKD